MGRSQITLTNNRPLIVALSLLFCAHGSLFAESDILKFDITKATETGTMHYSEKAVLSWKLSTLDLAKQTLISDESQTSGPLGLKQSPLTADSWLLWGWSSSGGGEETHHLFVVRAIDGKLTLADQLYISGPRGSVFTGIESKGGQTDLLVVGRGLESPKDEIRIQGAHFKQRPLQIFDARPLQPRSVKARKHWWAPYFLKSHLPDDLGWQLPIALKDHRFIVETKSKR